MAQLLVRNLDDELKERLKRRASLHGRSMEAEAREILSDALMPPDDREFGLGTRIAALFKDCGFAEPLLIPERVESDVVVFPK